MEPTGIKSSRPSDQPLKEPMLRQRRISAYSQSQKFEDWKRLESFHKWPSSLCCSRELPVSSSRSPCCYRKETKTINLHQYFLSQGHRHQNSFLISFRGNRESSRNFTAPENVHQGHGNLFFKFTPKTNLTHSTLISLQISAGHTILPPWFRSEIPRPARIWPWRKPS